jgi:amino acid transporter
VLVGVAIGSGIFRVPATVAAQLHDPGPVLLCWILGGLLALCGALTVAELAAALPRSGGIFIYILESFGPLPAFLFGWTELVVVRASALGAIATIFAEYLGYFVPLSAAGVRYVAAAAIVCIGAMNYLSVRQASSVMTVATVAKYVAAMVLGVLAFTASSGSMSHFTPAWGSGAHGSLLATALIPVMWTYDGWADLAFMGGEVKNPQRTLPLALVLGTICIMVVYLVINVGFMYLLPLPEIAQSKLIASTAAAHIPLFGRFGATIVAVVVVLSAFSGLNGSMMTGPRIFFAMAERGLFFSVIARVSPRFRSPSAAIWLATALGVVYVLQNDFAQLADKFILGIWPFYALAVAAVFVLRRKRPDMERPYRVVGYPFVPAAFLLASLGMVANALVTDPLNTSVTLGVIIAGVPAYYLWMAWRRHRG